MTTRLLGCGTLDEFGHSVGQQRAVSLPVADALVVEAHSLLTFTRNRVVKTHALDEPTVTAIAGISHDYVEKRALLGATTGKSNHNHLVLPSKNSV
jgi:hypothetical protein